MLELDIDLIIAYNLTLEEYVLLDLLRHKWYNKIRLYYNDKDKLHSLLNRLVLLGHLEISELGDKDTLASYKIKFFPRYLAKVEDEMVKEIMEAYPAKITRPNGVVDYLKPSAKVIKDQYKKIVKGNKSTHNHILSCLKYQIEQMTLTGKLQYIRKLTNWLEREEWREWEERMLGSSTFEEELGINTNKKVENIYGNLL